MASDSRVRPARGLRVRAIVIVEFPNVEAARAWYRSPEYAKALEVRDRALTRNLILVEGVASPI